jgi:hypothetical protein
MDDRDMADIEIDGDDWYFGKEDKAEPDKEYDCPIHGKLGGIDECPLC